MNEYSIFCYAYASFKGEQELLLKISALYFDKLYILDPVKAIWDGVGQNPLSHDLKLLEQENIPVHISSEDVLHKYEAIITESIRADLEDPKFLKLYERSGRVERWTLALAKVLEYVCDDPAFQPLDRSMQYIMGDVSRELSPDLDKYIKGYVEVYDEYRETDKGLIEYRYADYPLPLSEAIMINHALFGGLLHTSATPLTDDLFHNKVLALKIQRAQKIPEILAKLRHLKSNQLEMSTLTDIDLAVISPEMPMEEILQFRHENKECLENAQGELVRLARKIRQNPWSKEFAEELDVDVIPRIHGLMEENEKA